MSQEGRQGNGRGRMIIRGVQGRVQWCGSFDDSRFDVLMNIGPLTSDTVLACQI
jgi:hypothetical protein